MRHHLANVLVPFLLVGAATADTLSTFDSTDVAAFQAGRVVLTFDELTVPSPFHMPLPADTYLTAGIRIRAEASGADLTNIAQLPQLGHFGETHTPPNIIGGGVSPGSLGWRQTIRFDFPDRPAAAIGAHTDWSGSNTTLTAYAADGSVLEAVSGDQGAFLGVTAPGVSYALWTWNFDQSVAGFSLDNVTFSLQQPCPCERDGVEGVDVFDLLAYLDLWFLGDDHADFDGVPGVNVFDLLAYLDCWFPASAGGPCA